MKSKSISNITWKMFQQKSKNYLKCNFVSLDKYINSIEREGVSAEWHSIDNWEDLDDEVIYENIIILKIPAGELFVITEVCYKNDLGPFYLDASELRELVRKHLDKYGECFFNGDVIIFSFDLKMIWCFHHEGFYSLIELDGGTH